MIAREFKDLDALIDEQKYGPRGFIDSPNSIAKTFKELKFGLDDLPLSEPGKICTYAYIVSERTVLLPLDTGFPECSVFTKGTTIPRLVCIADSGKCSVGQNCMSILLGRLGTLASANPKWKLFVLYWRHNSRIMGLVVRAQDSKMRLITVNPHSLDYFISRAAEKYLVKF